MSYWLLNTDYVITRRLNLVVVLDSETLSSYLTPILAQYNVKYLDFIVLFVNEFSEYSKKAFPNLFNMKNSSVLSDEDLSIGVILNFDNFGKFTLSFEKPSICFLLNYFINNSFFGWNFEFKNILLYKLSWLLSYVVKFGVDTVTLKNNFLSLKYYLRNKKPFNIVLKKKIGSYKNVCWFHNTNLKYLWKRLKYFLNLYRFRMYKHYFHASYVCYFSITSLKFKNILFNKLTFLQNCLFFINDNLYIFSAKTYNDFLLVLKFFAENFFKTKVIVHGFVCSNNYCSFNFMTDWFASKNFIKNFNFFLLYYFLWKILYANYKFIVCKV